MQPIIALDFPMRPVFTETLGARERDNRRGYSMKKLLIASTLCFAAFPAMAWDDCRDKAVEVELDAATVTGPANNQTITPDGETEIFDSCIRSNTLVTLNAVSPISSAFRYWQLFPNTRYGRAVINHASMLPDQTRLFIATFKNVEMD